MERGIALLALVGAVSGERALTLDPEFPVRWAQVARATLLVTDP